MSVKDVELPVGHCDAGAVPDLLRCCARMYSRRSAIFCHSDAQLKAANEVRRKLVGDSPFASALDETAIEVAGDFYRAEEYHQRFLEKQRRGELWSPQI